MNSEYATRSGRRRTMDFNDKFPDEILGLVFKHIFRPEEAWQAAKVCKRWYAMQAINLLQKRRNGNVDGGFRCMRRKKRHRSSRVEHCDGKTHDLKVDKVESEWRLSVQLLQTCKRHVHNLDIKNCSLVSQRGYQLISAFASHLRVIRLGSCHTLDDAAFDLLLERCPTLRIVHLSSVKLSLTNIVEKAPKLQELYVRGCSKVTVKTLLRILSGLKNLRCLCLTSLANVPLHPDHSTTKSLCLADVGIGPHADDLSSRSGPRLQTLHLESSLAVNDFLLETIAPFLGNLKKLDLTSCSSVSDKGLQTVLSTCGRNLSSIVLRRCSGLTDESISTLIQTVEVLQDVSLTGCAITDKGMKDFMKGKFIPTLRTLSLAHCHLLTDGCLLDFASRESELFKFKTLDLQKCDGISAFGLQQLPERIHGRLYNILSEKKNVIITE